MSKPFVSDKPGDDRDTHPPHGQELQELQPEPEQHVLQASHPEQHVGQEPQLEQQSLHGVQPEQPLGQEPQLEQQLLHRLEQHSLVQQSPHDLQLEQQALHASQLEQQVLQESQPEQSQFKHGRTTPAQFTPATKSLSDAIDVGQNRCLLRTFQEALGYPRNVGDHRTTVGHQPLDESCRKDVFEPCSF